MLLDLVFPPFDYSVLMPEIGVPLLTANLRRAGYHVRQADLNIEFVIDELGSLKNYSRLLENFAPMSSSEKSGYLRDPDRFLQYLAREICRFKGRRLAHPQDPLQPVKEVERRAQKSCHLRPHQILSDWQKEIQEIGISAHAGGPATSGALEVLARHGARDVHFRARLLRLLNYYYFTPKTFHVDDVLNELNHHNVLLEPFYEARLDRLFAAGRPGMFGISIWSTSQLIPALILARCVKRMLPGVHVVAGGTWCSYAGTLIGEVPELFEFIDAFVVHEGDRAMQNLARALGQGEKADGLPNVLTYRTARKGRLAVEPPSPLEALELPVYDGFPVHLYPEQKLVLRLFRWCYWARCTICSHIRHPYNRRYASGKNTTLSSDYLKKIVAHIRDVKGRYGIDHFATADNLIPPGVMMQLCDLNRDLELGIRWDSLARFHREYTAQFCKALAQGGCRRLDLGLETVGNAALGKINKGIRIETVLRGLRNLKEAGVGAMVFVANYPRQSRQTYENTLKFLRDHRDLIPEISLSRFHLARGTLPYACPDRLGITHPGDAGKHLNVFDLPYTAQSELTDAEFFDVTRQYSHFFHGGGFAFRGDDLSNGWEMGLSTSMTETELTVSPNALAQRFQRLAKIWREECAHLSSIREMVLHHAYQQIVGIGSSALPFILKELECKPDHWFWALRAITGEDPVPPGHRGNVAQMAQDWLHWAERKRIR